jgi:hypothetical protein
MTRIRQPRRFELMQGDTGPALKLQLTDPDSNDAPIDLSAAGTSVALLVRTAGGETSTIATIPTTKLTGYVEEDGTVNEASPYNIAGAGGRVQVDSWPAEVNAALASYNGWVQITWASGLVQTLRRPVPIVVLPK